VNLNTKTSKKRNVGIIIPRHDVIVNQKAQIFTDKKKQANKMACRKG